MKSIKLPKELQTLLEFAEASEGETLVFTEKQRPVAALVSLRKVDAESLALSTNPDFLRIIDTSRQEIRAGGKASLEEVESKLAAKAAGKPVRRRNAAPRQ